jgi:two-component system sensor histidine kinase GlrK
MKVSSKIIAGFLILMLLGVIVLLNELNVIHQMQTVNQELSDINVYAATIVLDVQRRVDLIEDDTKKYLSSLDPLYYNLLADELRNELLADLDHLRQKVNSEREHSAIVKLGEAFDSYWITFHRFKEQNKAWDPDDYPPDITLAINHLHGQAEILSDAVQVVSKERVAAAAQVGANAQKVLWIAGGFSLLLGAMVAGLIVRSINDPLRRLMHGTRAIAKGQFWHRLPIRGKDEFAELARDFNVMTERLGELDQMKKDFVSHVSHDLKAPLASIRQIMHLLLEGIPGTLNEQQRGLIQLSYNSAERLAAMVGNLLDVSRMEAGTMEYQMAAHDIIPLVRSVMEEFDVQAQQKSIRLRMETLEPALFAECDRERIVQVIGNLYENALKFSPSESEVIARIGRGRAGEIIISVFDSGPGVPDDHKQKIFEKFHQMKQGKKLTGQGVGLGLAICKTIVEAHHGQIWVEDNPKGGSVFSFVLRPAAREEVLTCGQTA